MNEREALKLALEALERGETELRWKAITAIREALAQPDQKPVATVQCINGVTIGYLEVMQPIGTKLYTTPPHRKPLTDEE